MDEHDLIAGCRKRNPKAQQALYTLYASKMLSVCRRYVTDADTAQDVLQDGFVKVFTKIDTFTGEGAFGGWIRRIMVTTALEYLRRNDILKHSVPVENCQDVEDDLSTSVLSQLSAEDLLNTIAQLPVGYRTVFNLYAIEGYSHAEISEILNIKESTSQSQLVRARKLLQNNLRSTIGKEYATRGNQ